MEKALERDRALMSIFKHKVVRELAWAVGSCPLVKNSVHLPCCEESSCRSWLIEWTPRLKELDEDPSALLNFVGCLTSKRLGDYFARLVEFWLLHRPDVINLHANVQIKGERTVGEFDFIYFSLREQRTMHWEVAVKYFLYYRDLRGTRLLGPNLKDSLQAKLGHLQERQLRLSLHSLAQSWLASQGLSDPKVEAFIKGYIFYPWGDLFCEMPKEIHPCHLRGWWAGYRSPDWDAWSKHIISLQESRWCILPKSCWLTPQSWSSQDLFVLHTSNGLLQAIHDHFEEASNCLLIAQLEDCAGDWKEMSRGFIVGAHWPSAEPFESG
ncbi:hypothetical protein PNK_0750 [Candidatus Protochlamydia naegleriophila]|uniref:DUF1853 domain-containing protein n=1 Tax=Candidatus Protochlamydia naegleriophila TaxID=389348 RepID=A0A0U5J9A5_9BACT|nr:DUF1853 family protein [Candidatus Protochlamydia naegleriophila]CUI16376.1 hypothetical protein PNK_0750 [Candidatus Protochlamydia naegleriophila]